VNHKFRVNTHSLFWSFLAGLKALSFIIRAHVSRIYKPLGLSTRAKRNDWTVNEFPNERCLLWLQAFTELSNSHSDLTLIVQIPGEHLRRLTQTCAVFRVTVVDRLSECCRVAGRWTAEIGCELLGIIETNHCVPVKRDGWRKCYE
jgi:hypothetical protein